MQRQNTSISSPQQERRQNVNNDNGNNKQQTTTTTTTTPVSQLVPPPLNLVAISSKLFALNRNVIIVAEFVREQIHALTHPKTSGTSTEDALANLKNAADCLEYIISNGDKTIKSLGVTTTRTSALPYAQRRIEHHQYGQEFHRGNFVKPAEAKFKKVYAEMNGSSTGCSGSGQNEPRKRGATEAASSQEPASKVARRTAPTTEEEDDDDGSDGNDEHANTIHRAIELLRDSPTQVSPPANGKYYTPLELIPQLVAIENRKTRWKTWRYVVSKGFAPHMPGTSLRRFLTWCREGDWEKLDRPWKVDPGRKPLLTVDEAKQLAERTPGIGSYSNAQISEILIDVQKKRNEAAGRDDPIRDPDNTGINNYRNLFASFEPITEKGSSDEEEEDNESTTSAASAEPFDAATLTKLMEEAPVRWNPPANGKEYTVREVAGPLITIRDNQTRWNQWEYLKSNRLVPDVPHKTIRKYIQQARWGKLDPDQPWSTTGEPAPMKPSAKKLRLTREDMKKIITLRRELGAGPMTDREFKDIVRLAEHQKAEAGGGSKPARLNGKTIKAYRVIYESILEEEEEEEESD